MVVFVEEALGAKAVEAVVDGGSLVNDIVGYRCSLMNYVHGYSSLMYVVVGPGQTIPFSVETPANRLLQKMNFCQLTIRNSQQALDHQQLNEN